MASQATGFAELLAGGLLVTMGLSGEGIRQVLKGGGGKVKPLAGPAPAVGGRVGAGPESAPQPSGASGRADPLPGWTRGRIDQGVDFSGGSKIYAPEAATVTQVGAPGWPEGGGVVLRLAKGGYLYIYEGLRSLVKVGERVSAGQQIASAIPGGSIEVGFSDASGVPLAHSEYTADGIVTRFGKAAARWLNLIGAPR